MKSAESQVFLWHCAEEDKPPSTAMNTVKINQFLQGVEKKAFIIARLATKDTDEALDIVQEAMLKLVQHYLNSDELEWGALFHTILQSKINDWYRRQQVRNRWRVFFHSDAQEEEGELDPKEWVAQDVFLEPEHYLGVEELNDRLLKVIGQLPLRQQQALILRAWEGYNITQTANIMKCSEGSVKTHYSRAIHSLRAKLEDFT